MNEGVIYAIPSIIIIIALIIFYVLFFVYHKFCIFGRIGTNQLGYDIRKCVFCYREQELMAVDKHKKYWLDVEKEYRDTNTNIPTKTEKGK